MNAAVSTIHHHDNTVQQQEEWELARFTRGWVKAWRDTLDGDLADNMCLWALWHWLLLVAVWKPTKIIWKGQRREIPPGTIIMSPRELANKWECSHSHIWKWLKYLETNGEISIESSTRGTLVTIRNWYDLQSRDDESSTPRERDEDTTSTDRVHGENLSKEEKKEELKNLSLSYEKLEREILEKFPNDKEKLRKAYEYFEREKKDLRGNPIGSTLGLIQSSWPSIRDAVLDLDEEEKTNKCSHKYWDTDPFTGTAKCVACKFEIARAQ
jgi:DNA-binding transcriptional regulator YhcF (GntR family)